MLPMETVVFAFNMCVRTRRFPATSVCIRPDAYGMQSVEILRMVLLCVAMSTGKVATACTECREFLWMLGGDIFVRIVITFGACAGGFSSARFF